MIPGATREIKPRGGDGIAAVALGTLAAAGTMLAVAGAIGLAGQTRDLHLLAFALAFGVALPAVAYGVVRLAGLGRERLADDALVTGAAMVALLGLLRLLGAAGASADALAVLSIVAGPALSAVALAPLAGRSLGAPLASLGEGARAALAAALAVATLLIFAPAAISPATAIVAIATGLLAARLLGIEPLPSLPRTAAIALDALLLLIVALLAIDLTGYWGPDFAVNAWANVPPERLGPVVQIHQHFYLGPVGDVLSGRTLLVDADAVYGVGNTYLFAAWFQLVPFGYGGFGLLGSLLTAAMVVGGWAIARAAGVGRLIAALTLAVAALVTVLAPINSPSLFLNIGGLRFGPPLVLLAVAMLLVGRPGPVSRSPWVLATFAFFSLWSVEAISYCGCTWLAIALADAVETGAIRAGARQVGGGLLRLAGAALVAQLLLALATLVASGELPDWSGYLELFRAWAEILENTFGAVVEPFSRSWLLGALYLASGVGALLLLTEPGADTSRRRRAYAIAGLSAAGASFLSYFVAHALDVFLPFIVLPALLLVGIWLSAAIEGRAGEPGPWRRAALGVVAALGVLLVAGSWGGATDRLPRTALAHLVPGGPSLIDDARRMWNSPRIDPRAVAAEALIERNIPGDRALVLTEPDLGQEALLRTDRANLLPISYPWQDEVVLDQSLPPVLEAIEELPPGTRALLQEPPAPGALPSAALAFEQGFGNVPPGERLGPLAAAAEEAIRERYELEVVERGPDGLYVAELVPR